MFRPAILIRSVILFASALLFTFICWMIYLANTGTSPKSIFFPLFKIGYELPYGDKIGHFVLFGPLAFAVNAALQFKKLRLGTSAVYFGSLLVISFVLTEELSQYFFPRRTVELLDLLADSAGIALFTWLSHLLEQKIWWRNSVTPLHLPVSP